MFKKITYIVSGFIGGLLLCLGITRSKKNNSGSNSRIDSADSGVDLSGLAEVVTERNNRNIEKLRDLSNSLGGQQESGDSERIRELVADLRAEQQDGSVN